MGAHPNIYYWVTTLTESPVISLMGVTYYISGVFNPCFLYKNSDINQQDQKKGI